MADYAHTHAHTKPRMEAGTLPKNDQLTVDVNLYYHPSDWEFDPKIRFVFPSIVTGKLQILPSRPIGMNSPCPMVGIVYYL